METDDERLDRYFASLEREGCYEVKAVLKESPNETTQLVSLVGTGEASRGPFVRKLIKRESGLGSAYERLYQAQRQGQRFKFVPFIWECYANDACLVVVMERVVGESLDSYVTRKGASPVLARDVFPRLCDAVSELHEDLNPPLIHRDLKPSNVVLTERGLAIIDFGIARDFREGARSDTTRFGTCSFAPPEQFGFGQTTVRSDVFALGAILFFCLTGVVSDTYVAEEDLVNSGIPLELRAVIARATALNQIDRYASAGELKRAFLAAVDESGPDAAASEQVDRVVPESGDAKAWWAGGIDVPQPRADAKRSGSAFTNAQQHGILGALRHEGLEARPDSGPDTRQRGDYNAQQRGEGNGMPARQPEQERFTTLGKVWNAFLVVVAVLFIVSCVGSFVSPSEQMSRYPVWVNAPAYLLFMPLFVVSGLWMLSDKRRLAKRFPRLRRYRFWHWVILFGAAFIVMFFGIGLSGVFSGVS